MRAHPHPLGHSAPRPTGRPLAAAVVLAGLAVLSGCANSGGVGYRQGMVGSLRSSVTQLEAEKQDLQKELADTKSENRRLEDRLVQEEAHSAALASRLKSTRVSDTSPIDDRRNVADLDLDEEPRRGSSTPRATPAGRSSARKTPFAQIPGEIRPMPEDDFDAPAAPRSSRTDDASDLFPSASRSASDDPIGSQSRVDISRSRWLPVARGSIGSDTTVR